MKVKVKEILKVVGDANNSPLDNLRNQQLLFETSLKLKDIVETILDKNEKIKTSIDELLAEYTKKNWIDSKHPEWKEFNKDYNKALEVIIELDFIKLNKSELINIIISEKDLEELEFLIDMEE